MRFWGRQISSLRVIGLLGVVLTGVLLGAPAVAGAEIVYATGAGAGISVAHDDGSQAHQLISVTQVPGMNSIGAPAVAINNDPTLMFTGTTDAFPSTDYGICGYPAYPCDTSYDGTEATGVYKLQNGTLTRLSGPPGPCTDCSSYEETPEPTGDGNYFYDAWACGGSVGAGDFQCLGSIYRGSTAGGTATQFEPNCSTEFSQHATPNPVNSAQIAFDGCPVSGSDLEVSGASGAGDVVLASAPTGAGITFNDTSWRPDGGQVIAYQGGQDESGNPGIYAYNPSGGGSPTLMLAASLDPSSTGGTYPYVFSDPRYIGSAKIMFSADGNLYTIPASCVGCSFPADATQLISGATEASWTSQVIDASSGGGGGTTPTPPPAAPVTKPPALPTLTAISQTQRSWREGNSNAGLARKSTRRSPVGTSFAFTLDEAGRVSFVFTQSAAGRKVARKCQAPTKHNRKQPRCRRTLTRGTLTYSATTGHHKLAFQGRTANKRLPLGAYTLQLTATNTSGGRSRSHTLRFTIVK
jgi:hypothetical protein